MPCDSDTIVQNYVVKVSAEGYYSKLLKDVKVCTTLNVDLDTVAESKTCGAAFHYNFGYTILLWQEIIVYSNNVQVE